jgi:hypothetical protein
MSTRTITLPADQWEAILKVVQGCWDEGPRGEDWQSSRLSAASAALSAALAQPEPEGDRLFHWRDLGDGKPIQVQECPMCGIAPANVDDCGRFGDPACPCFGVGKPEPEDVQPWPIPGDVEGLAEVFWGPRVHPRPEGPISESELAAMWNQQADAFNQWESLDSGEQLAWAQARAIARYARPATEPEFTAEEVEMIQAPWSLLSPPQPELEGASDEALANFTAWFCRNYPGPDTIIHKPEWHAPKVFRAAADALARWGRPAIEPVPVSERLPEPGKKVLAHYLNALGKPRTIIAEWVPAKTREDSPEGDLGEYDDETDLFYWPEGWYEQIENWDDFTALLVDEGEITHWQPLPRGPHYAPPIPVTQ